MHVNSFISYYTLRFNRRERVDYRIIVVLVNSYFTSAYLYCFVVR